MDLPKATQDRMAEGRAERGEGSTSAHAPAGRRRRAPGLSTRSKRREPLACARSGADPPWPDGGFAVHLLSGRRRSWHLGSRRTPDHRSESAVLRRRSPVGTSACSRRRTGGWSSTSTAPTRPFGAGRMGREVPRRESAVAAQDSAFKPKQQRVAARASATATSRKTMAKLATSRFFSMSEYDRTCVDDLMAEITSATPTARKQLEEGVEGAAPYDLGSTDKFAEKGWTALTASRSGPPIVVKPPERKQALRRSCAARYVTERTLSPDPPGWCSTTTTTWTSPGR